jgi:hypothetical protein
MRPFPYYAPPTATYKAPFLTLHPQAYALLHTYTYASTRQSAFYADSGPGNTRYVFNPNSAPCKRGVYSKCPESKTHNSPSAYESQGKENR